MLGFPPFSFGNPVSGNDTEISHMSPLEFQKRSQVQCPDLPRYLFLFYRSDEVMSNYFRHAEH